MKKKLGTKSVLALESHGLGGSLEVVPSMNKPSTSTTYNNKTNGNSSSNGAAKSSASKEDEDLLKAIELSLKETNTQPGYSAPSFKRTEPAVKKPLPTEEEEDADLLAAIEASLRETSIHSSHSVSAPRSAQRQSSYSSYTYTKKPVVRL